MSIKRIRTYLLYILLPVLASCQFNKVCPAYQSMFILDKKDQDQFFSLFETDSIPKELPKVDKNKSGIVQHPGYVQRTLAMKTVPMRNIFPGELTEQPSDTSSATGLPIYADASGVQGVDSLMADADPYDYLKQFRYNVDQENYALLFGEYLPQAPEVSEDAAEQEAMSKKSSKKWWQFWKKKEPAEIDEVTGEEVEEQQEAKPRKWWQFWKKKEETIEEEAAPEEEQINEDDFFWSDEPEQAAEPANPPAPPGAGN